MSVASLSFLQSTIGSSHQLRFDGATTRLNPSGTRPQSLVMVQAKTTTRREDRTARHSRIRKKVPISRCLGKQDFYWFVWNELSRNGVYITMFFDMFCHLYCFFMHFNRYSIYGKFYWNQPVILDLSKILNSLS